MAQRNGYFKLSLSIIALLGGSICVGLGVMYNNGPAAAVEDSLHDHCAMDGHPVMVQRVQSLSKAVERRLDKLEAGQIIMQHDLTEVLRRLPIGD